MIRLLSLPVLILILTSSVSLAQSFGFRAGDRLPVFIFFRADNIRHRTDEFIGRWFVLKRGAAWCTPCVAERPLVKRFTSDHPDVPVVMGVVPPPPDFSMTARIAQMQKDVEFNTNHGLDSKTVVVFEGRTPAAKEIPAPSGFELLPITIITNPAGIVVRSWNPYEMPAEIRRDEADVGAQVNWDDLAEATLICAGDAVKTKSPVAYRLARDPHFCKR